MEILQISKSRLREGLLNLYFANPNKKFYLRELERILDFSVANIRRELIKLKKIGLFRIENRGNLTYYYLNKSFPLFQELKSIISKTSGVPRILKESLKKVKGIECAFIYGSFAKVKENYISDIDLVAIGDPDEDELIKELDKLKEQLQHSFEDLKTGRG